MSGYVLFDFCLFVIGGTEQTNESMKEKISNINKYVHIPNSFIQRKKGNTMFSTEKTLLIS